MNFTKTMFALAIGSAGIMGAMSASAATMTPGWTMSITAGVPTFDGSGTYTGVSSGSWFAMDTDGGSKIAGTEKVALSQGTAGIVIGATTTPGASHPGAPTAGDTNAITAPWNFFGNTGSDYVTTGITQTSATTLNMSGWTVTWNGVPVIPMGSGAWTPLNAAAAGMATSGYANGVGVLNWNGVSGSTYTLDYTATVPLGDASGFGGVKYGLHLTGVAAVPEASTYGMMLAGLGLVGFVASRRRKSI